MNIPRATGNIGYAVQMVFDRLLRSLQYWLTTAFDPVSNLAALALVDAGQLPTGAVKRVNSLRTNFILDKASVLAPDTITVIAAVGGGRWIRQAPDGADRVWLEQAEWYIDPAVGNDESSGNVAAPLKTWAEFARRTGYDAGEVLAASTVVNVQGSIPGTDPITVDVSVPRGKYFVLQGARTTVVDGVVLAYNANLATNQEPQLSIAGFNALGNEGLLIRFPDAFGVGVDGWSWVEKNLGNGPGGLFRITHPITVDLNAWPPFVTILPGDSVQIVSLLMAPLEKVSARGEYTFGDAFPPVLVRDLHVPTQGEVFGYNALSTHDSPGYANLQFWNARIGDIIQVNSPAYNNCFSTGLSRFLGAASVQGGYYNLSSLLQDNFYYWTVPHFQKLSVSAGHLVVDDGMGLFGSTATTVSINYGGSIIAKRSYSYIFGNVGNNAQGFNVTESGTVIYASGTLVFAGPATPSVGIDGVTWLVSELPYASPNTNSGFMSASAPRTGTGGKTVIQVGVKGPVTNALRYALADLTESATNVMPFVSTAPGILRNLRLSAGTAPGAVNIVVRVLVNGVFPANGLTITTAAAAASDLAHTSKVAAGDTISFEVTAANVGWSNVVLTTEVS